MDKSKKSLSDRGLLRIQQVSFQKLYAPLVPLKSFLTAPFNFRKLYDRPQVAASYHLDF